MSNICAIGANVCDTLVCVNKYPKEDTKMRADMLIKSGGGPAATGIVAASKLGEKCTFIGNMTDDTDGVFLKDDFEKYSVNTDLCNVLSGYQSFSSFVMLSDEKKTRTCVFYKGNIPSLKLSKKQIDAIKKAKILMVDGNEIDAATEGAKIAKENGVKVLYDAGGLYDNVEKLLCHTDILIPSEEFALGHTKENTVEAAAKKLIEMYKSEIVVITCGKAGGILYDGKEFKKYDAFLVDAVDTNGAGDVFHGAFAFALTKGFNYYECCIFSSAVSALKCKKIGARASVPTFDETIEFLKEQGYEL